MSDSATMDFELARFNADVEQKYLQGHKSARSVVRTMAMRLVKKLAWNAPKASRAFAASGRLRAGFWPAATALGITSIYTEFPNIGEGSCQHNLDSDSSTPFVRIVNSVPYVSTVTGIGIEWQERSAAEAADRIETEIINQFQAVMSL